MSRITLPGLVDLHVHLRSPGQEYKEDFSSGTRAALAGGFTAIFDMPNNKVPITNRKRLVEKMKIAQDQIYSDVGFYFGSLGDNLKEFERVSNEVWGLKLYLNETTGNFLISKEKLKEIFIAWKKASDKPILVHAEDDAIEAVIRIVKKTGQQVHFCHISLKSDLEQIMEAKSSLPITCGVTPHHLFLAEDDAKKLGPFGRMKPYLKSREDLDFLWSNIRYIDAVESDHAPHTRAEKESATPPFGVPGLETTLPLLLTAVHDGRIELSEITRLCHDGPKKILGFDGYTGVIEVDTGHSLIINHKSLFTKAGWSPFVGRRLFGKVKRVILRGGQVFDGKQILAERNGRVITPSS